MADSGTDAAAAAVFGDGQDVDGEEPVRPDRLALLYAKDCIIEHD